LCWLAPDSVGSRPGYQRKYNERQARRINERLDGAAIYRNFDQIAPGYISLDTALNVEEIFVPSKLSAPMITTAINAAIKAYSIAVTARLSSLTIGTRLRSLTMMLYNLSGTKKLRLPNKCVSPTDTQWF
jgi:hypothetical protein